MDARSSICGALQSRLFGRSHSIKKPWKAPIWHLGEKRGHAESTSSASALEKRGSGKHEIGVPSATLACVYSPQMVRDQMETGGAWI